MTTFTTSDGLKLYYEDAGTGLPVLCLAGLTRTGADFNYVAPHLAGHRVIRLDYRGRGRSEWDPDWTHYSLPVECRDVLELLAHLSLDRVAIIGTSRGGLNAMVLAATAKERLIGVLLNDVGPVIEPAGVEAIRAYIGFNPAAKSPEEMAAALAHVMTGFKNVPPDRWLTEARTHYKATEDGLKITYDPKLREATLAMADGPPIDLWPFFEALSGLPTLCLRGANSNLLSAATVAEMQRRMPDMMAATVPDRGHVPFMDEPQALAAIRDWLGKLT
jgi:pimeloyl-ACP methyl ester carboxylesterase